MDRPYDNIINIKHFTNTLLYAWKYHTIGSTELTPQYVGLISSTQQGSTRVRYWERFYKVRSDSAENKFDPVQFLIHYDAEFAWRHTAMYQLNITTKHLIIYAASILSSKHQ